MHRLDSSSSRFPNPARPEHPLLAVICCLCTFLAFASASQAQTTSTIEGIVTDRQGLALSGAEVRAEATNIVTTRTTLTDAGGNYQVPALPAGIYRITVSHAGFRTHISENLEVTLNRAVRLDITLEVGSAEGQKIRVTAEPPLLETESSSEGITILPRYREHADQWTELPRPTATGSRRGD